MTNKIKNQNGKNLPKNQGSKAFSISDISDVMDLCSWKSALINLYNYEPEPLFINGQFLYI
jgi:hypothetical protein